MKKSAIVLLTAVLALVSAAAQAQTRMFVRGTITSLSGNVLSVKSRDGKDLKINLAPKFGVRSPTERSKRFRSRYSLPIAAARCPKVTCPGISSRGRS